MNVLVINAGSSSLKYQLLNPDTGVLLAKGLCERIGLDGRFTYKPQLPGRAIRDAEKLAMPTHAEAISEVLRALADPENGVVSSMDEIGAVGHRVVHGGESFAESVLIDEDVLRAVEACTPLAPLHNPANITGILACRAALGEGVPQVAVFDTAFHQTMPEHAYLYSIPYAFYEKDRMRRYGFHGTSHRYISLRAAELLGKRPEELKLVSCHLGNGASLAAIDCGRCVDTSMGMTPLAGLTMGTRAGDMDAGVVEYIANKYSMTVSETVRVLNKESGVLGLSGVSSDFRDLHAAAGQGHRRAALALDVFCYGVRKMIAGYAAAMGGVDTVVFTAGVGENSADTRARILRGLEFMGITCDEEKNRFSGEERIISRDGAPVTVMVVPTNEELMIAQDTFALVAQEKSA